MGRAAGVVAALYGAELDWEDSVYAGFELHTWSADRAVSSLPPEKKAAVMELVRNMSYNRTAKELDENFNWRAEENDVSPSDLAVHPV